jgi:hypothetical protein
MWAIAAGIFWDAGLSIIAYYALRAFGASATAALIAGSVTALLRMLFVAVRARKLDVFAAIMAAVFAVGLATSLITGDPRFLLVKESFGTGTVGVLFLGSCFVGRPLVFFAAKRMAPGREEEWEHNWATLPGFRRVFVLMSAVWGCGLLLEALVRIPLVFLLPVDVMVALSNVLLLVAMALLAAWTGWYARRFRTVDSEPDTEKAEGGTK